MGMAESSTISAIYQDPQAKIFRSADLGVVGDYLEVFPERIGRLRQGFSFGLRRGQWTVSPGGLAGYTRRPHPFAQGSDAAGTRSM
jgi:hypothetical protein